MNIALDIGNVLIRTDLESFAEKLVEKKLLPSVKEAMPVIENLQTSLDLGLTDLGEALDRRFGTLDKKLKKELHKSWLNTLKPVEEINELISEMHYYNHQIALLSNIGFDHAKFIRDELGGPFNDCIQHFSCEVGVRKPSLLFFQSFIIAHPEFKGAQFLDDRDENVAAANLSLFSASLFNLEVMSNDSAALALRECFPKVEVDVEREI